MKRSMAVAILAVAAACNGPHAPRRPGLALPAQMRIRTGAKVVTVPLETYVLGTVLTEVTPVGETPEVVSRIYEVQAIVARSYAAARRGRHAADGFDLCDTTHCQAYEPDRLRTSRFAPAAAAAVRRTRGVILAHDNRPAEGLFHADCGGSTADASTVWGGPSISYLRARRDDLPAGTHRAWQFRVEGARLRAALNSDARTEIGRRLTAIAAGTRDVSGRPSTITITGDRTRDVRAEDFRTAVNRTFGQRALLSTKFGVERTGDSWLFDGRGFGHGVGLCQAGARARARRGDTTGEILGAYFATVEVRAVKGS